MIRLGLQSWSGGRLGANFYGVREKRGGRVVDLRIKNMVRVSMAPLPVGQGSREPARGGVLGVSSATSFFLNSP